MSWGMHDLATGYLHLSLSPTTLCGSGKVPCPLHSLTWSSQRNAPKRCVGKRHFYLRNKVKQQQNSKLKFRSRCSASRFPQCRGCEPGLPDEELKTIRKGVCFL